MCMFGWGIHVYEHRTISLATKCVLYFVQKFKVLSGDINDNHNPCKQISFGYYFTVFWGVFILGGGGI